MLHSAPLNNRSCRFSSYSLVSCSCDCSGVALGAAVNPCAVYQQRQPMRCYFIGRSLSLISVGFYLGLWYAVPYEALLATIHIRSWSFPLLPAAKYELGLQHHKKQSMILHWVTVPESQTYSCAVGAAIIFPAAKLRWLSAILPFGRHKDKQVPHNIFEKFRAQDHKIFEPQG